MAILKSLVCSFLLSFSVIYALQTRQIDQLTLEDSLPKPLSPLPKPLQLSAEDQKKYETCGNHEIFSSCEAHCEQTCDNFDKPRSCPRFCASGCVCEEGYVRDKIGNCIPVHQCPVRNEPQLVRQGRQCRRENEYYDICRKHCEKDCYNYNKEVPCWGCREGCLCKPGLVRGPQGICIPVEQCPASQPLETPPKCEENEYFEVCKAHCQKDCSNYDSPFYCPPTCVSGCVCEEGYVRGPDGRCTPVEQCPMLKESQSALTPPKCEENEYFEVCKAHCQKDCSNYESPFYCPPTCVSGCVCEEGYVRGPDGRCMPVEQCPMQRQSQYLKIKPKCPANEQFHVCNALCQKDCSNFDRPTSCPAICVPGCICEAGYVRGPYGRCIPSEQCPLTTENQLQKSQPKCEENEYFEVCKAHCQKDCSNYDRPMYCPATCVSGCVCEEGYVRGPNGKCIPFEQCPMPRESQSSQAQPNCEENEYFEVCKAHCQKDCSNYDRPMYCPATCVSGCVCEEGYVRGPNGKCIPFEQCPMPRESQSSQVFARCPLHEHFDVCKGHCQKDCSNLDNPLICPSVCIPGCVCNEGYVRGPRGKCIPIRQCQVPTKSSCPINEHFDNCRAHCQKSCSNYNEITVCPEECNPGCVCDPGFVRGPQGRCVPLRLCSLLNKQQTEIPPFDRNCPPREHWEFCTGHCQRNCSNYDKPLVCPQICVEGCLCNRGYTRGPRGNCIPESECQVVLSEQTTERSTDVCTENEEYSHCDANPMCQKTCSNYDKSIFCPKVCVPGCVCKEGYVKSSEGECIPVETCMRQNEQLQDQCPQNMEYSQCEADPWCQKDCTNYNDKLNSCPRSCVSGCVCKEGFVRGPHGHCVSTESCSLPRITEFQQSSTESCPENEEYSMCEAACQKSCIAPNPHYCPKVCIPGCVCKEGFFRSSFGECIPFEMCPSELSPVSKRHECPENKHYSRCGGSILCQETCSSFNKPDSCAVMCIGGCVCDEGFILGPDGNCIPPSQCPEEKEQNPLQRQFPMPIICRRDESFSICATACPDDCFNYKDTDRYCPYMCRPGCTCKKGTVRGPEGDCIKSEKCPVQKKSEDCSQFEYYDTCGTSCPDDCTNYNQLNKQCTQQCVAGCFCQPGFVRGPNGNCIFPFNCPKQQLNQQSQPNQQVSSEGSFDFGCPNERLCNSECKRMGHSYGMCIGQGDSNCQCF